MTRTAGSWLGGAITSLVMAASTAHAQVPTVLAPPNIVLPNYNSQTPGLTGSLEAGAMVARGDDASAAWYNPAGLSRIKNTTVSASGGVIQWLRVSPNAFPNKGGSTGHVPVQIGIVWKEPFDYIGWAAAVSFVASNTWEQEISSELQVGTALVPERFAYAASSSYSRYVGGIAAGYSPDEKLRLGGSVDFEIATLNQAQSVNDRVIGLNRLTSTLVASHSRADFAHLRLTLGAQYDITEKFHVGGAVKTPGIQLVHDGTAGLDATIYRGGRTFNASYYDEHPETNLKIPFEFTAGAAFSSGRAAVEGDLRIVQGVGVYDFYTPTKPLMLVADSGTGAAPVATETAFRSYKIDSAAVVDFLVGGHVVLTEAHKVTVHGGFAYGNSPVGDSDEVFQKANMLRLTVGLSAQTTHFTFAGGLNYQSGTTPLYDVYIAETGQAIRTTIDIQGVAFVYSFAVRF